MSYPSRRMTAEALIDLPIMSVTEAEGYLTALGTDLSRASEAASEAREWFEHIQGLHLRAGRILTAALRREIAKGVISDE